MAHVVLGRFWGPGVLPLPPIVVSTPEFFRSREYVQDPFALPPVVVVCLL